MDYKSTIYVGNKYWRFIFLWISYNIFPQLYHPNHPYRPNHPNHHMTHVLVLDPRLSSSKSSIPIIPITPIIYMTQVLVLDAGRVKEFDSPAGLLADKYFSFNLYLCCNLNLYLCLRVYLNLNLNFSKNILLQRVEFEICVVI